MRGAGCRIEQLPLPATAARGTFVAPTLIEIRNIAEVQREVFGPVLHVLRYRRANLEALVDAINDTGYALTFGLHTRIDETIALVTERIAAGNIYVNRNLMSLHSFTQAPSGKWPSPLFVTAAARHVFN